MEPKDIKEINIILKNSFSAIRKDMDAMKAAIATVKNAGLVSESQMRKDVAELKESAVRIDKLNLMKIRLDEINNNISHLYLATERLARLEKDAITKKDVDKVRDEFRGDMNDFVGETGSRLDNLRKEVRIAKEKEEKLLSKDEFNGFISTLNNELNYLRKTIEKTYDIKDTITKRELDAKTNALKDEVERVKKALIDAEKKAKENADSASRNAGEIARLESAIVANFNTVKNKLSEKITESQIKTLIADVNSELDRIRAEIVKLKESASEQKDIRKSLNELRRTVALEEEVEVLQKTIDSLKEQIVSGRDIARMIREKAPATRIEKIAKIEEKRVNGEKKEYRKTLFFANTFITLSFASLIGALVAFFLENPVHMDGLSIAAIAWFGVGILLRVFVILRRR